MPPFRIVARHPETGHHDHAWFAVGGVYDPIEDAQELLDSVGDHEPPRPSSLPVDQRVRVTVADRLAELAHDGYEIKLQDLVVKTEGTDDGGATVATEHKWKDVK